MKEQLNNIKILGVVINTNPEREILEYITKSLRGSSQKLKIFTPNPELIMIARRDLSYQNVLNSAQVSLPDGVGVVWAARKHGKRLQGRITGVSFMEKLCKECARMGLSIGLLGGQAGVAEKVAECLVAKYPELKINYIAQEWDQDGFARAQELRIKNQEAKVKKESEKSHDSSSIIHDSLEGKKFQTAQAENTKKQSEHIDIFFVAFGSPKQEKWIAEHLQEIPAGAVMGVGGAFDFISGRVNRAPHFIQAAGLEWLYRLIRQPWRWKRQLALPQFAFLVMTQKTKTS